ncbi:zinc-ribbon domain-containing protein [Myceligenerans pegani]|uniref:Zinc-ribbon domain-containing protein n=1 Tax=Myceligenerans pegani TaxID=2776917 RepID=A0ABR9MXJ4_9MICO|nr:zinc-ribbon domain-containing protein [Myceligenerans sp. TRM 65318]MBE1876106.1 zinc-ribbon domain-containing protein [Myceligenerans sp. TRM 65318]MBE3018377.1 zinc-ribbon domain-containing protein [Myceligenerans sp. TRM 65318]
MPVQTPCAEPGCPTPAAFTTRTKPAWCNEHIIAILAVGGLEPVEPFPGKPTAWWLTKCTRCGCVAHYRLVYVLDNNKIDTPTCRACHWRDWAATARRLQGPYAGTEPVPIEKARTLAENNGYEYLGGLTDPSLPDDPHHVRCVYCGRLSADRLGDIAWGCQCQVNPRRNASSEASPKRVKVLFKDSDSPAVDWWDHGRNSAESWATATPKARRVVWWLCPECGHNFEKRVLDMTGGVACPVCEPRRQAAWSAAVDKYKHTPVSSLAELLEAWDDEADPATVMIAGDWELRRFRCPAGHHPRVGPLRYLTAGCPHCRGQRTMQNTLAALEDDLAAYGMNPEIAAQWHPSKNQGLKQAHIPPTSRRTVWWREESCGHEWMATPTERDKRQRLRCPECRTILDSLAYHFPALARQWAPDNPVTAWHVRPSATLSFVPRWICPQNPDHVWEASLISRTSGSTCPMCKQVGTSAPELAILQAAHDRFGNATSGRPLRHQAFTTRAVWHPDVTVDLPDGDLLVIEYDGSYWHANKAHVDLAKSLDLLAAGHHLVRLREHPLPPLTIKSERYYEIIVYATAPDPTNVVAEIAAWLPMAETKPLP